MQQIQLKQLNSDQISGLVTGIASYGFLSGILDFEYVSGMVYRYVTETGFISNNMVATSGGSQDVYGIKTFYQSPLSVPASGGSGLATFGQLTGTGANYLTKVEANTSGFMTGEYGKERVTFNFYSALPTVQDTVSEQFVGHNWYLTGYYLSCNVTGTGGSPLTGTVYQKSPTNTSETVKLIDMALTDVYKVSGFNDYLITGSSRLGVSITASPSGISGLTVGLFGYSLS